MTTYSLAQFSWDDDKVITISSPDDQLIATLPLEFLRRGNVNNWAYIFDVVSQLLQEVDGWQFYHRNGASVLLTSAPAAGDYVLARPITLNPEAGTAAARQQDHARIQFASGPEYFRRNVAPNPVGSQSTRSDSKRSTIQQVRRHDTDRPADRLAVRIPRSAYRERLRMPGHGCIIRGMHCMSHSASKSARCQWQWNSAPSQSSLLTLPGISEPSCHPLPSTLVQRFRWIVTTG